MERCGDAVLMLRYVLATIPADSYAGIRPLSD